MLTRAVDLGRHQKSNFGHPTFAVSWDTLVCVQLLNSISLPAHGRHLTLLRYPQCTRLVQVGLPNRLRGELWETLSGSLYLRFENPGLYQKILADNAGRVSASTEDIEKDLNRSLPEYSAYQTEKGIDALRRVLTAYSWKNPEVGYCQVGSLIQYANLCQGYWFILSLERQ